MQVGWVGGGEDVELEDEGGGGVQGLDEGRVAGLDSGGGRVLGGGSGHNVGLVGGDE